MRFFLEISFKGDQYAGWQTQNNQPTVQTTIRDALSVILERDIQITGAGRTDSKVHCKQIFAHFDFHEQPQDNFVNRINKYLPKDISIKRILQVSDDAHARFDAIRRDYEYHIHTVKDPFLEGRSYYFPFPKLDLSLLKEAAALYMEYEDYAPLSKANPDTPSTICKIARSEIIEPGENRLVFHVAANRFLHNMVRRMTGAILMVGSGKLKLEELKGALESLKLMRLNITAPPQGLYLTAVYYPYLK